MKTLFKNQVWLLRRETWEHRAFWITPLVVSTILVIMGLAGVGGMIGVDDLLINSNSNDMAELGRSDHSVLLTLNAGLQSAPYAIALFIMVLFYCLDSLYSDRRDRSIMFWRSLPVSDTATVLSKLTSAVFIAPAITFVCFIAINLLSLLVLSIGGAFVGISYWYWLTHPGMVLLVWLHIASDLLMWSLVFLPIYGWLLLASAWARKAAFLWAVAPPLLIMWVEWMIYDTSYLARCIGQYFSAAVTNLKNDGSLAIFYDKGEAIGKHFEKASDIGQLEPLLKGEWFWTIFSLPEFWAGMMLATLFVAGAIWLRRWRNEE